MIIINGRLSVMEVGIAEKLELCVDSLDSQKMEEVIKITISIKVDHNDK